MFGEESWLPHIAWYGGGTRFLGFLTVVLPHQRIMDALFTHHVVEVTSAVDVAHRLAMIESSFLAWANAL